MKFLNVKVVTNKKNGQVNISLPKKKLSKSVLHDIKNNKSIKIKI